MELVNKFLGVPFVYGLVMNLLVYIVVFSICWVFNNNKFVFIANLHNLLLVPLLVYTLEFKDNYKYKESLMVSVIVSVLYNKLYDKQFKITSMYVIQKFVIFLRSFVLYLSLPSKYSLYSYVDLTFLITFNMYGFLCELLNMVDSKYKSILCYILGKLKILTFLITIYTICFDSYSAYNIYFKLNYFSFALYLICMLTNTVIKLINLYTTHKKFFDKKSE